MTPDDNTNQELMIEVGDGHTLYVHDWGKADAAKVIIQLHGGPGSASRDGNKDMYDPNTQRVIFYDQRGCGRSVPYGSIEHNTTDDLIADIITIADELKLGKFILTGGSWGSCLALTFAIKHPERVEAMVLRGILTASKSELDWIDHGLFRIFYPEVWEKYLQATPQEHHKDPSAYHHRTVSGDDQAAAKRSAYAYANLEGGVLNLDDRYTPGNYEEFDPASMRIEMHYLQHDCFLADRYILEHAAKLTMPVWLVQGRYDMVCPPTTAYELHQRLPDSHLAWTLEGHRAGHETWNLMRTILIQLTSDNKGK